MPALIPKRTRIVLSLALSACLGTTGCAAQPKAAQSTASLTTPSPATPTPPTATARAAPSLAAVTTSEPSPTAVPVGPTPCSPSDQDSFVYRPSRLHVLAPCLRVTGTVRSLRVQSDGDLHIRLALDPSFGRLLRPANMTKQSGALLLEPICVHPPTSEPARTVCRADADPVRNLPEIGMHIWVEGRWVIDTEEGGWAELHPIYRWGSVQ